MPVLINGIEYMVGHPSTEPVVSRREPALCELVGYPKYPNAKVYSVFGGNLLLTYTGTEGRFVGLQCESLLCTKAHLLKGWS